MVKSLISRSVEKLTIVNLRNVVQRSVPTFGTVLDLGCGTWGSWDYYKTHKMLYTTNSDWQITDFVRVYGVDKKFGTDCTDLNTFEDEMFDCVVFSGVIQYLDKYDKALDEIWRVLKPDGTLILTTINQNCLWRRLGIIKKEVKGDERQIFTLPDLIIILHNHRFTQQETSGADFIPLPKRQCSNVIIICKK
jgi:SAM-dependent methyltransferase